MLGALAKHGIESQAQEGRNHGENDNFNNHLAYPAFEQGIGLAFLVPLSPIDRAYGANPQRWIERMGPFFGKAMALSHRLREFPAGATRRAELQRMQQHDPKTPISRAES
jgi:hypothetical protein